MAVVAVLGAGGMMGWPMARNLARAGHAVRAWEGLAHERAERLRDDGADVLARPGQAARGAEVLITMLPDAEIALDVVPAALEELPAEAVWVQMGTLGIDGTERCGALAREHGVAFVDAPVLGTVKPAEEAALVVLASGPEEQRDRLAPVFEALGQRTMWLGEAGAGSRLKVVTNAWILAVVEGAAEAIALAEGIGADPRDFLAAVAGGPLDVGYLQLRGRAMIERDFAPSFRLRLAAKDARLADEAARAHGL